MAPETVLQTITGYHIALWLLAWAAWRWLLRTPRKRGNAKPRGGAFQAERVAPQPGPASPPPRARRGPGGPSEKEMM